MLAVGLAVDPRIDRPARRASHLHHGARSVGSAESRCKVNVQSLVSEFLRLSGLYPELRHAVVVGDKQWASMKLPLDEMRMFDVRELKPIHAYGVNSDRFARVYCLWQGIPAQNRERAAEDEFHRLAQIAARLVPLEKLPSRSGPVQLTCKASVCVVEPRDGHVKTGIPQVQIPLINQWVSLVSQRYSNNSNWLGLGGCGKL